MADDLLKFDIDSFLLWINAVRRPFVTIAELLSDEDERRSLTAVFQLWIVSAILSTAVASVIVQFILKTPVELKDTLYYFASGMLFFFADSSRFAFELEANRDSLKLLDNGSNPKCHELLQSNTDGVPRSSPLAELIGKSD